MGSTTGNSCQATPVNSTIVDSQPGTQRRMARARRSKLAPSRITWWLLKQDGTPVTPRTPGAHSLAQAAQSPDLFLPTPSRVQPTSSNKKKRRGRKKKQAPASTARPLFSAPEAGQESHNDASPILSKMKPQEDQVSKPNRRSSPQAKKTVVDEDNGTQDRSFAAAQTGNGTLRGDGTSQVAKI